MNADPNAEARWYAQHSTELRYGKAVRADSGRKLAPCRDCSTRSTIVMVDVDAIPEHDAGHSG